MAEQVERYFRITLPVPRLQLNGAFLAGSSSQRRGLRKPRARNVSMNSDSG